MVRLTLALSLVISFMHAAATRPPLGTQVEAERGGIKVTLSLPRQVYPGDALIRAAIRVQNLTDHPVWLTDGCPPVELPRLEVLDGSDAVVYPPLFPTFIPISCPPLPPPQDWTGGIQPGKVSTRVLYAVARADRLRAVAGVDWPVGADIQGTQVETPILAVHLTSGTPPRMDLTDTRYESTVVVHPSGPVHGPLLYQEQAICRDGSSTAYIETSGWTPADGDRIERQCSVAEWHVVAGWVGQPVVSLDYLRPQ